VACYLHRMEFWRSDRNFAFPLNFSADLRVESDDRGANKKFSEECIKCKVGGYHGGDYEEWRLLACYVMCLL
jgi:hypothetical protein